MNCAGSHTWHCTTTVDLASMSLTRRTFFSVTGRLISVALVGCARTQPAWETSIASLEGRITELMKKLRVPGVSIAIVRDAQIAWTNSFGVRDTSTGAAVDDGTIFSAQSMSKPVFAYRVMKLCEQGVLDLDAPLTDYTSDVFVKDDPRLKEITPRRVLSHTSGLPNWRSKETPLRIDFTPGTKWQYSGEGYHYLQSVVTRLVGHEDQNQCRNFEMDYRVCATDFGEYMAANLLRPFGMDSSGYLLTPAMESKLARPHDKDGKPIQQTPAAAADIAAALARYGSAGSLMTTAVDYARFLVEVMQPRPADDYRLNVASLKEMLKPHIEAAGPIKASWALGWQIWHLEEGDVMAHGGDFDGWHSQSAFSLERKNGFVILTNGENGAAMIWNELLEPLVSEFIFRND